MCHLDSINQLSGGYFDIELDFRPFNVFYHKYRTLIRSERLIFLYNFRRRIALFNRFYCCSENLSIYTMVLMRSQNIFFRDFGADVYLRSRRMLVGFAVYRLYRPLLQDSLFPISVPRVRSRFVFCPIFPSAWYEGDNLFTDYRFKQKSIVILVGRWVQVECRLKRPVPVHNQIPWKRYPRLRGDSPSEAGHIWWFFLTGETEDESGTLKIRPQSNFNVGLRWNPSLPELFSEINAESRDEATFL